MNTVTPKVYLIGRPSVVWDDNSAPALRDFMADHGLESVHSDDAAPAEIIPEIGGRIDYWSFDHARRRPGGARAYFARLLAEGHTNVIELAHWNFIIRCSQGVAREILRYRTAERSQASTRYIDYGDVPMVSIAGTAAGVPDEEISSRFDAGWRRSYCESFRQHTESGRRLGLAGTALRKWARSHAARYVPFGAATWLVLAVNCQTARHLILQRANLAAHPEFRGLAVELARIMKKEAPNVFHDLEEFADRDGEPSVRQNAGAGKAGAPVLHAEAAAALASQHDHARSRAVREDRQMVVPVLTEEHFGEIRERATGFVVSVESSGPCVVHRAGCSSLDPNAFRRRVILGRGRAGGFLFSTGARAAYAEAGPGALECSCCRPGEPASQDAGHSSVAGASAAISDRSS